ncbi:ABC transporter ATP-binding protein [Campylobacter fetus]|uniref:ABC transporter ATP-binding protein n=1 Tax=Campylobacter fetus TaxID=196 RepID=UPI001671E743|nr:ABC transporter ATP-binding protein [Campylobacter fetus]HDX6330816.1 ABC transporter ATP-binding protein [Campylobacter fetus subsp. venerealis]
MIALKVESLNKIYKSYESNISRIVTWFGLKHNSSRDISILKDINFEIHSGQTVGLIGQNGAGKSTLLKIITGTLKPTSANITINGKISSILELGMGFSGELTGRQNAYHSAGLMGYRKKEIDEVISYIEDFAEIGEYFDKPVRLYSSGMQMRLAFAIVTAKRPEILIIDEALSVGDIYFQHKSFSKIREFSKAGTTLLIVSHDLMAIQSICQRAILLDKGQILKDDTPDVVLDFYNAMISKKQGNHIVQQKLSNGKIKTTSGSKDANIIDAYIINHKGVKTSDLETCESITLKLQIKINKDIDDLVLGFIIKDRFGLTMYGTNTHHLGKTLVNLKKGEILNYSFDFKLNLGSGSYSFSAALHSGDSHLEQNYEWSDNILIINVKNTLYPYFNGCVFLEPNLRIDK